MNLLRAAKMAVGTCEAEDLPASSEASITHLSKVIDKITARKESALSIAIRLVNEYASKLDIDSHINLRKAIAREFRHYR